MTSPHTGEVKALVGGRDASYEGFNRALDARRPIGSLIKPAVYLAALESGRYSLASVIDDAPIVVQLDKRNTWTPSNFDDQAHGLVPLVRALAESYNMATVRLGLDVGLEPIADTLQRLGLAAEADAVPLDAARRARVDADRGRADLQHARERRLPRAAARRAQRRRARTASCCSATRSRSRKPRIPAPSTR